MEKQKVPIINILLANGVQSKFRDSDVPPLKGPHHVNEGQIFDEGLELSMQNTTAYKHTLIGTSVFFCGRVAQLATELGPPEMVRLLIDGGSVLLAYGTKGTPHV
jgi:hypothetical protein